MIKHAMQRKVKVAQITAFSDLCGQKTQLTEDLKLFFHDVIMLICERIYLGVCVDNAASGDYWIGGEPLIVAVVVTGQSPCPLEWVCEN